MPLSLRASHQDAILWSRVVPIYYIGVVPFSNIVSRNDLDGAMKKYEPIQLRVEPEAVALADRYVETGVIPPSAATDALHMAIAAVEELNVVVSLNMRHIVRLKTRTGVNGINRLEGYRDIEIATPEEVLGYAGD
jgi:hypothetical protein